MNEHKRFKKKNISSIDGILSDGRQLGVSSEASAAAPSLDRLVRNRGDGFHPLRQSPHSLGRTPNIAKDSTHVVEAEDALDEPIVLDDIPAAEKPAHRRRRIHLFPWELPKRAKLLLAATALFVLAGFIYFGIKFYITQKHVFKGGGSSPALSQCANIDELKQEGDCRINILMLGIGGPGHDGPNLTDTIMLVSIDPFNNKIGLLSLPRDLWVNIPGHGTQKINAAFSYGMDDAKSTNLTVERREGLKLLDKTLSPIINFPIHYHAIVDFSAFKEMVNTVGGVKVNVPEELYDPTIAWENHYNPVIAKKGVQVFNGQQALLYVKSRETSSDFARAERQRLVMVALKDKVFSLGTFSNPIKISELLNSLGSNVYTDFSLHDITKLYGLTSKIPSQSISSLDMVKPPNDLLTTGSVYTNGTRLSIVRPKAGLFDYTAIQSFVHRMLRDGVLAKESATVVIYNATDNPGLGNKIAEKLTGLGYIVSKVGNAPTSNPEKTVIVDMNSGKNKYTSHYLEVRFKTKPVYHLPESSGISPPAEANFVIILGKDAATSS